MITVNFYRKGNYLAGFDISGHANCGEAGTDIVCAAVSSAVQLTANLITEIFGFSADVETKDNFISLKCDKLVGIEAENADKILSGFELQLRLIRGDYKNRIDIEYTEV